MPYVDPQARALIATGTPPATVGELTFVVYRAALRYLVGSPNSYQTRAEIIAALECAKQEFYRRHVAPYEDRKIEENGDVL
jgi:hypothetical protein